MIDDPALAQLVVFKICEILIVIGFDRFAKVIDPDTRLKFERVLVKHRIVDTFSLIPNLFCFIVFFSGTHPAEYTVVYLSTQGLFTTLLFTRESIQFTKNESISKKLKEKVS